MEMLIDDEVHLDPDTKRFWDLRVFDTVDSTNTRIKEAIAQGASEGTCFAALEQTAAYGRQGRSWSSPEGGLYFSFVLDPLQAHPEAKKALADLPALSLVMSLGVQAGLAPFAKSDVIKIKWPNDIVVDEGARYAKLCGISLEVVSGKLCCGVGVNVSRPAAADDNEQQAVSPASYSIVYLQDLCQDSPVGDHEDKIVSSVNLLPSLLHSIMQIYQRWLQDGIEPLITHYDELLFNVGREVVLETVDGKMLYEGTVLGVSLSGELCLRTAAGAIVEVSSGEVHTRAS